ncbi:MAG TPA: hypothetical protein VKO63_10390, partial [Chitinispirillaceae bacterium]|nr:hypothetical protein [Chitinispirillaceae bacterium]
ILLFFSLTAFAEIPSDILAGITKYTPELTKFAANEIIITEVKKANASQPAELSSMTNDKWKNLSILSPEVKLITKGELSQFLVKNKPAFVSEIFISPKNGTKVGFISKPTSWSHLGKPKHDIPMQGKNWTGDVELDESTGIKQIQVSFPVLDESKKAIGSIVFGLDVAKITAK